MVSPIWKDYTVDLGTTDGQAFTIYDGADNTGTAIYSGKAYIKPGASHAYVKINDICSDYLYQEMKSAAVPIRKTFSVYAGSTKKAEVEFFLCRDYSTGDQLSLEYLANFPITGRIQDGMPIPITKYSKQSQGIRIDYDDSTYYWDITATADVRNWLTGGPTGYKSVQISPIVSSVITPSLGFSLKIIPQCHRYQLYYQNMMGGIDCLVIEGKAVKKDGYKRTTISKTYDNSILPTPGTDQIVIRNAEKAVIANDITRTWELHTGWLTDAEAGRMGHLLSSPLVYLLDCLERIYYPVVITNPDMVYKTYRNDGMIDFGINVELAETLKR